MEGVGGLGRGSGEWGIYTWRKNGTNRRLCLLQEPWKREDKREREKERKEIEKEETLNDLQRKRRRH